MLSTSFRMVFVVSILMFPVHPLMADALEKLAPERLKAVHTAIEMLRGDWQAVERRAPWQEHRANLHVHSHWSHDSEGKIDEILEAAKAVGTTVLMFSEHPADHYDFFLQGHQGTRDGILMIPGAEMQGFLVYPTLSLRGLSPESPQELSDLVRGRSGHLFVSHPEERMEWSIQGVTGMEIYNTHADFKDETAFIAALKNPFRMIPLADRIRQYPQECYSALQDYPAAYLKRWDELCLKAPHTGVSANDAHQNVGFVIRWIEDDRANVEDALGKSLIDLDLSFIPDSQKLRENKKPGDVLFRMQLDPYENSLRHVATHLLLKELSESEVRESLDAGRAFVAFDWLADSTGFDFTVKMGSDRLEMGSRQPLAGMATADAKAPLPVHWRLIRNGELIEEQSGRTMEYQVTRPGVYRIEAWLEIAGERMPWILSNPVYLTAPDSEDYGN